MEVVLSFVLQFEHKSGRAALLRMRRQIFPFTVTRRKRLIFFFLHQVKTVDRIIDELLRRLGVGSQLQSLTFKFDEISNDFLFNFV